MDDILQKLHKGLTTESAAETQAVARDLALQLPSNHTLALYGGLGAGKTTFVQGLAQAWGIKEPVTSPTFNILSLYRGARNLVHLDAFRLENEAQIEALMLEEWLEPPWCWVIEWPDNLGATLPHDAWRLHLELLPNDQRRMSLRSYLPLNKDHGGTCSGGR